MASEHAIDRSGWPRGPWDDEPDRIEWRSEETGLPCLMVRNTIGAWCGYVAVAPKHPWHGLDYSNEALVDVEAHGGLTYSAACMGPICHVPQPGESDDVWWLGFDCCHYLDLYPSQRSGGGVYRRAAWVRDEVERLARQVRAAGTEPGRGRS